VKRKPFIAGNWKMHLDREGAIALARGVRERFGAKNDRDVAVCPPYVYLADVANVLKGSSIRVGAQDVCDHARGAFTGEVSAAMLADVGASFTIVGHSERRHVYGESDELVQRKVERALAADLQVILCVGELLVERDQGLTEKVVSRQLSAALKGVGAQALAGVTIAYEPVWAIGTGRNATPDQVAEAHSYLRGLLSGLYDESVAERVRIQYGGSVKPDNVAKLMAVPNVDGALVGGASLELDSFSAIVEYK
jgi:triosephosphate isomerase